VGPPNDQLRTARRRTASLTHPDECLTRQELAELVNTWVWEHHDKKVEATANYVGKLEQGIIRWPGTLCREAFQAISGVSTDSDPGFVNARSRRAAVKLDKVKRKQFIHNAAGTIRSRRTAEELRELVRYAAAHQHLDEVAHLRHRIKTLVCVDSP